MPEPVDNVIDEPEPHDPNKPLEWRNADEDYCPMFIGGKHLFGPLYRGQRKCVDCGFTANRVSPERWTAMERDSWNG